LLCGIGQKTDETICQILGIARLVEFNCHSFAVRHLAKIFQIGAHDRNAVGAGQVRDSAATCGRGVRHNRDRGALEKIGQIVFVDVAGEFDFRICRTLLLHRFDIASGLRVIPACNH